MPEPARVPSMGNRPVIPLGEGFRLFPALRPNPATQSLPYDFVKAPLDGSVISDPGRWIETWRVEVQIGTALRPLWRAQPVHLPEDAMQVADPNRTDFDDVTDAMRAVAHFRRQPQP